MTLVKASRRAVLQGLGAAAIGLPLLESTGRAQTTAPKRLLFVFSPNGTLYEEWQPTGTETAFDFRRILAPLTPYKQDLIILDNVKNEAAHHGPGDAHMTGMGCLLTATELLQGTQFKCSGTDPCSGWGGGISVDQFIADKLQPTTKFRTLELAARAGGASIWSRMVYAAADRPIAPMEDPSAVFTRLFADLQIDTAALDRARAQKQSVLDFVNRRLASVRMKVAGEDRVKIDAHVEALRDIERRLTAQGAAAGCSKPATPAAFDFRANDTFPQTVKLHSDLLVRAFACDLTRIATLQLSRSVGGERFTWIGIDRDHHDMSHDGDSNTDTKEKLVAINKWYAEQLAYLIGEMKKIPEGNGTMLDNTVIVWGNELGRGNSHSRTKVPFVLAGGAGGYFKTGRWLKYNDDSHSNLLVSLCNAMGVATNTFGNPAYCQGPLRFLHA